MTGQRRHQTGAGHDILENLLMRVSDMERRMNNVMRPAKIVDIDEENGKVRVQFSATDEGQPVLSPWISWTERSGNVRTWNPPTVGEQVHMFSPSGEVGLHSWVMPGGANDKFQQTHGKRDEQRDTIEVIETSNTSGNNGTGGAPPNTSKGEPGPTSMVTSTVRSGGSTHTVYAEKDDDGEQTSHEDLPGKAKKLTSVQNKPGERDEILEDKESGKRTRVIQSASSIRLITSDENGESEIVMSGGTIQLKCNNMTFDASESVNHVGEGSLNMNPSEWPTHPDAAPAGDWEGV